jgi:hypothetical protein
VAEIEPGAVLNFAETRGISQAKKFFMRAASFCDAWHGLF